MAARSNAGQLPRKKYILGCNVEVAEWICPRDEHPLIKIKSLRLRRVAAETDTLRKTLFRSAVIAK